MNRFELNRNRTIRDIQESFFELYAANEIDKISVQQVCSKCHISRTIFYKYFDDKYAVLETIENELMEGVAFVNRILPETPLDVYRPGMPFPVFFETAKYINENKIFFKPLLSPHGDPHFIFRWKKQIRKDVRTKFEHDSIAAVNLDVVTELFAAAIIGLYTYWFFENPDLTEQEISEIAGNLLCGSFYNFKH